MKKLTVALLALSFLICQGQAKKVKAPAPCGPVPTENQLRWHHLYLSVNIFGIHF